MPFPVHTFLKKVNVVIPREGLLVEYLFDGNALDTSGNNNNAVLSTNPPTLTTDRKGTANKAYAFNGIDNYMNLTTPINFGTGAFAFSFWVKKELATFTTQRCAFSIEDPPFLATPNMYFQFRRATGNDTSWRTSNGTTVDDLDGSAINNTNWTHYVFQRDASGNKSIYKSAVNEANSNDGSYNITPAGETTYIGGLVARNDQYFYGDLDQVRIYNRILTQDEIDNLSKE